MGDDHMPTDVNPELELLAARPEPAGQGDRMQGRVRAKLFGAATAPGDASASDDAPKHIGHFPVLGKLGAGGMGQVFLARDEPLERFVAIKVVHEDRLSDDYYRRLRREASTLGQLEHPHVIAVYGFGEHEGRPFIVMQYAERGSLSRLVRDNLATQETLFELCRQAGEGLAAAHRAGVIHADFKPANILVDKDGRARVADFGFAQVGDGETDDRETLPTGTRPTDGPISSSLTTKHCAGTPEYMAPELFAGARPDTRTDLFAYCVSLWEVLGGQRPFTREALVLASTRNELPRPRRSGFRGKRWLRRLIERGLAVDPSRRWSSIQELLDAFDRHARRRRQVLRGTLAMTTTAALVAFAALWPDGPPRECRGDPIAVWSPEARAEFEARLATTELPYADVTRITIMNALDSLDAEFTRVNADLCRDHHETGSLSATGFDAGLACLRRAERRTLALLQSMRAQPERALEHVDDLIAQFPIPAACREFGVRPTRFSELMITSLAHEHPQAHAHAAFGLGQYEEAAALAAVAVRRAPPNSAAQAQALLLAGAAAYALYQPADARISSHASARAAVHSGAVDIEFHAALQLVKLAVFEFAHVDDARLWLSTAANALEAMDRDPSLSAQFDLASAAVDELAGDSEGAEVKLRRAIEALATHADELHAKLRLANLLAERGDVVAATELYTELLTHQRDRLGVTHPTVGLIEFDFGITLHDQARWSEAREMLLLALEHRQPALGMDSPHIAVILTGLASTEVELGNAARSIELAERAWTIQREQPRTHPDRGSALIVLGYARSEQENFEGALADYQTMLDELELDPIGVAGIRQTRAWLLSRLGRWEEARAQASAALLTTDEQIWRRARFTLAEVEFRTGERAAARAQIEQLRGEAPLQPPDLDLDAELVWLAALIGRDPGLAREALRQQARLSRVQIAELHEVFPKLHD